MNLKWLLNFQNAPLRDVAIVISKQMGEIALLGDTSTKCSVVEAILKYYWRVLKVVGNEKLGGSRGWLLVEGDTKLWRSMSVCFLM
jgi:hypothetical protein